MTHTKRLKLILSCLLVLATGLAMTLGLSACGGSSDTAKNLSASERFELAKQKFHDGDYLEAINEFNIIKLQFPGSNIADSSQYLLAESRFQRGEYLLAGEEYQALRRNFPASPLVPQGQYKIGLCYYQLAPKSTLDQRYTLKAIDEFQAFIEYNPNDTLVKEASTKIQELNNRLAKKDFETAELYMKLEYYKSATYYYNSVFEKYHDTQYGELALLGKVRALIARKKYEDARPDVERFRQLYPASTHLGDIEQLQKDIDDHAGAKSAVSPGKDETGRS